MPLVANGKVYVAAYKTLMIFGPNAPTVVPAAVAAAASASAREHPFSESDAAEPALPLGAVRRRLQMGLPWTSGGRGHAGQAEPRGMA